MSKFLLLTYSLFVLSCSHIKVLDKPQARSHMAYVLGPLPDDVQMDDVAENLSRWQHVEGIGKVHVQLITPAYIYLAGRFKKTFEYANRSEMLQKINQEIDFLYRYNTCFALTLETTNHLATNFQFWKAYIAYGENSLLTTKVTDTTELVKGMPYYTPSGIENYRAHATICADDRIDLENTFTLVLRPNYRPVLPQVRLTWLASTWSIGHREYLKKKFNNVHKRSVDPTPDEQINQNTELNLQRVDLK